MKAAFFLFAASLATLAIYLSAGDQLKQSKLDPSQIAPKNPPSQIQIESSQASSGAAPKTQTSLPEKPFVIREALWKTEAHPRFHDYLNIETKALKSTDDQLNLQRNYQDSEIIKLSFQLLSESNAKGWSETASSHRLYAIDFLEKALSWKENPRRELILSELELLLRRPPPTHIHDKHVRKAFVGDRIELFELMVNEDLNRASSIYSSSRSKESQKAYRIGLENFVRRNRSSI